MKLSPICLLTWAILEQCENRLTQTQLNVVVSLSNELVARHCVIVTDGNVSSHVVSVKHASKFEISTTFMSVRQLNFSMHDYDRWFRTKTMVVIDVQDVPAALSVLFLIDHEKLVWKFVWVMFAKSKEENFDPYFYAYIPYHCLFLFVAPQFENGYTITELYNVHLFQAYIRRNRFGIWFPDEGLLTDERDFYRRRFDMNKTVLGVLTAYEHEECKDFQTCSYTEICEDMARMTNFKLLPMAWTEVSVYFGNLTTMFEIYLGPLIYDSISRINMVAPIWKTQLFLHISHDPVYEQRGVSPFRRPFTYQVWTLILIWVLVSSSVVVLIDFSIVTARNTKRKFQIANTCYQALEAFSNQCGSRISDDHSARLGALTSRVAAAVIVPAYGGAVISFITVRYINLPFTDVQGLMRDGSFKVGYDNSTVISNLIHIRGDAVLNSDFENVLLKPEEMTKGANEGLERLCTDKKFSFLSFDNYLYNLKIPQGCTILQLPKPVVISWGGFTLRPGSPYRFLFNRLLKTFRSAGILERNGKGVYEAKSNTETREADHRVEIKAFKPVYKALAIVYASSLAILVLEMLVKFVTTRRNANRNSDSTRSLTVTTTAIRPVKRGRRYRSSLLEMVQ